MSSQKFFDDLPQHLIHAILTYYGNWLAGDERGFRTKDHRIHSSGDYKNPPPKGEHARLHDYVIRSMNAESVRLSQSERPVVGRAFLRKIVKMGFQPFVVAACPTHLHILYCGDASDALKHLGRAKQFASHQLKSRTGRLWAGGGKVIRIKTLDHANRAFPYVSDHEWKENGWVWRADRDSEGTV